MSGFYLIGNLLTISFLLQLESRQDSVPSLELATAPGSASHPALRPGDGSKLV
jgi:hypothetical protein